MIGDKELGGWCMPQSEAIAAFVKETLAVMPCHDWDHTERVLRNAREIVRAEQAEDRLPIIELAALLHDIARPKELITKQCHARLGAEMVPDILRRFGVDETLIAPVALCVRRHRFRSDDRPLTIEEQIIYDADKLDAIGAVGVARAFYFAGRLGSRLHNTAEEALAAEDHSENDTAFREYLVKLRMIPEKMCTESGRRFARIRNQFSKLFFETLNWEVIGIPPET